MTKSDLPARVLSSSSVTTASFIAQASDPKGDKAKEGLEQAAYPMTLNLLKDS